MGKRQRRRQRELGARVGANEPKPLSKRTIRRIRDTRLRLP